MPTLRELQLLFLGTAVEAALAVEEDFDVGGCMLPLLGMIAVIQTFVYPNAWSEHLTWGSILLFLLTRGGGAISLDRLFGLEPTHTDKGFQESPE